MAHLLPKKETKQFQLAAVATCTLPLQLAVPKKEKRVYHGVAVADSRQQLLEKETRLKKSQKMLSG
jgi:hypothetical protein